MSRGSDNHDGRSESKLPDGNAGSIDGQGGGSGTDASTSGNANSSGTTSGSASGAGMTTISSAGTASAGGPSVDPDADVANLVAAFCAAARGCTLSVESPARRRAALVRGAADCEVSLAPPRATRCGEAEAVAF